jgi:hypothetical protein
VPKPGEIAKQQAGKDGDQRVGKNLCHSRVVTPSSTALRYVHVRPDFWKQQTTHPG